jgi:hypothetical protein
MPLHAASPPSGALALASNLFLLVPSCLMTLAPVTVPTNTGLTQAKVDGILDQCGPHVVLIPQADVERQLTATGSDLKGYVTFAYVGLVRDFAPFEIAGDGFAFISAIGFTDDAAAQRAGERMAHRRRTDTSSRGFICANAIVQRIAGNAVNPDKLDRFLLERFASAATN